MFNEKFLSSLNILYIEDEELARETLAKTLRRFFKNVYLAKNGLEGYLTFKKEQESGNIDLILSDINMPKMNGVQLLEKIREEGHLVPVIFTTARTEVEFLLKAIEYNVNHYILKPINIQDTISKIQEVCEKKYYQHLVKQKQIELEQYSNILDNVAVVFKLNPDKKITFMNSLLLESFGMKEEDVLNKHINSLLHKEFDPNFINEVWDVVKKGKSWHGNIKFVNSKEKEFYINSTFFQIISDTGFEYVNIGFESTKEVKEKREFQKKVIEKLKNSNIESSKVKSEIQTQKKYIEQLNNVIIKLKAQIHTEKEKRLSNAGQLDHLEKELSGNSDRIESMLVVKNREIKTYQDSMDNLKKDMTLLNKHYKKLETELMNAHEEIEDFEREISRKDKRIGTLSDLLDERETILKRINPDLV